MAAMLNPPASASLVERWRHTLFSDTPSAVVSSLLLIGIAYALWQAFRWGVLDAVARPDAAACRGGRVGGRGVRARGGRGAGGRGAGGAGAGVRAGAGRLVRPGRSRAGRRRRPAGGTWGFGGWGAPAPHPIGGAQV